MGIEDIDLKQALQPDVVPTTPSVPITSDPKATGGPDFVPTTPNINASSTSVDGVEFGEEDGNVLLDNDFLDEFSEPFPWQSFLHDRLRRELITVADNMGMDRFTMETWFGQAFIPLVGYLENNVLFPAASGQTTLNPDGSRSSVLNPGEQGTSDWWTTNPSGLEQLHLVARNWLVGQFPALNDFFDVRGVSSSSGGRGRGGGGGSRRPTADEIRAQFDIDQLSNGVTEMWRGLLVDEPTDPRGIARAYVEAVVANPDQKLDFQTYVRTQIEGTGRFASIYAMKPEGMSPEQYIAPYLQSAAAVVGGGSQSAFRKLVVGGAQFGADPGSFLNRLRRTREATSSQGFITGIEQRMREVKGVLKG